MTKLTAMLLVFFSLAACGGGGNGQIVPTASDPGTPQTGPNISTEAPITIPPTITPLSPTAPITPLPPNAPPASIPLTTSSEPVENSIAYPFGARLTAYSYGILPTNVSNAQMDATIKNNYATWKSTLVVDVPTITGGKAVKFNDSYITVSEGIGYGMLLSVVMAGHDPQARALFDGLLTTARARPAYSVPDQANIGKWLMDWRLTSNGSSTEAAGGGWNAMDGDLDIAMALLMADKQWGSTGTWNYKQQALRTISAMKAFNFRADGTTMGLGQGHVSRTSDYMIGHFRAFKIATGDAFWETAISRSYALIDLMQTVHSSNAGLTPDFIIRTDTANPIPSPGFYGDYTDTEGFYFANAQRNPLRWGTDYVFSGDVRWKNATGKIVDFFIRDTNGVPNNMKIGYRLNGSSMGNMWPATGLVSGGMVGGLTDAKYQNWVNASWTWSANAFTPEYYSAELILLAMLVASGNWWTPN